MCCVCVIIPFILAVRLVDAPAAGVTQEDCHTGFLRLPSAELALIFLARRLQSLFLSLVDREVEFSVPSTGRPGSSEVPRNPLTRWDVSSTPANGIFSLKKTKKQN